jgi:hypothetical protein
MSSKTLMRLHQAGGLLERAFNLFAVSLFLPRRFLSLALNAVRFLASGVLLSVW